MQPSDLNPPLDSSGKQQDWTRTRISRVAIVSTGFVGSTTAYALLISGTAAEVVLINRDQRRAEGHVPRFAGRGRFSHHTRVFAGEFGDCCSADVTIITTGVSQAGRKSRLDGLKETAAILKGLVLDVSRQNPNGILLIASNPVDVMTHAAWKWSGLPASSASSVRVHAYIIGEYGDSQIPVLSRPQPRSSNETLRLCTKWNRNDESNLFDLR